MIEIKAQVLSSKAIKLSKNVFSNKLENSTTKVIFDSIEENANLLNKYVAFLNPNGEVFLFPLNKEDNSFIVTTAITKIDGVYSMLFLSTNSEFNEETGELLDPNFKTYISNPTKFTINSNFLDEESLEEPEVDPNILNVWEEINQTIIYLNSESFQEEIINNLHISESDIETITNNLKNDETFKEAIKGEDGVPGKDGRGIYEEWIDQNKYIEGLVDGSKLFYWNKKVLETILSQSPFFNDEVVLETDATILKYNHNDRVFNIYNSNDLNNRVGWVTLSEEIQKEKESSYFTLNTSTKIISILDGLFLKVPFIYVDEYTEEYMKGPQGPAGPAGIGEKGDPGERGKDGESAFDIWAKNQPSPRQQLEEEHIFNLETDLDEKLYFTNETLKILRENPYTVSFGLRFIKENGSSNAADDVEISIMNNDYGIELGTTFSVHNKCYQEGSGSYIYFQNNFKFISGEITGNEYTTLREIINNIVIVVRKNGEYLYNSVDTCGWKNAELVCNGRIFEISSLIERPAYIATEGGGASYTEEEFLESLKGDKGEQGDTYTITEQDYEEIANIVLSKMINAEEVGY